MTQFFRNNDLLEWVDTGDISVAGGSSGETTIFGTFFWNAQGSSQPPVTISQEEFGVTESVPDGYPRFFMRVLPASAPILSGTDRAFLEYKLIEDGDRAFQGAYGIFSFWCRTPLAKEIVVRCIRDLGTGGQTITGASTVEIGRQSFQLTNGWKKYEVKFRFEELAGATYGANSTIKIRIYLQGGSGELGGNGINWVNSRTDFAAFSFTRQAEKEFERARLSSDLVGYGGVMMQSANLSDVANAVTARTNLDIERRHWFNVREYGAVGDGVTDDTAAVVAAYNAISSTYGGTLFFPSDGQWKYNLVILKPNITVQGGTHYVDGYSGTTNLRSRHIPADITKPVIQIGDDTAYVRGVHIRDVTLYGGNTGQIGIYFAGGAFQNSVDNTTIGFFQTCLKIQGGTSLPASLIAFRRLLIQPSNVAGGRGVHLIQTANYPTSWTTAINFTDCHIQGPSSGSNCYAMETDSVGVYLNNTYFDMSDGHGVKVSKNFTPLPFLYCANVAFDSNPGTGAAIEIYSLNRYFSDVIAGSYTISGKWVLSDATPMTPPGGSTRNNISILNPHVQGNLSIVPTNDPAFDGSSYTLHRLFVSSGNLFLETAGSFKMRPAFGVAQIEGQALDGVSQLLFFDPLNTKTVSITAVAGFLNFQAAAGEGIRLRSSDGLITGLQVNGTGAGVFLLGTNIVANQNLYVDNNKQIQSGVLVDFVQNAAATVANTVAETTIIGTVTGPGKTLIANRLTVGKNFKGRFRGRYSTTGTPTLQLKVKFGSVVLLDTGAITLGAGVTNKYFEIEFDITCRTTGSSGTVFAEGKAIFDTTIIPIVNTAAATIDTTATQTVDVTATWGTANSANTITGATGLFQEGF